MTKTKAFTWRINGKASQADVAEVARRAFGVEMLHAADSPTAQRALTAVEEFVSKARTEVPLDAVVSYRTSGRLELDGRGSVDVKITIGSPRAARKPRRVAKAKKAKKRSRR